MLDAVVAGFCCCCMLLMLDVIVGCCCWMLDVMMKTYLPCLCIVKIMLMILLLISGITNRPVGQVAQTILSDTKNTNKYQTQEEITGFRRKSTELEDSQ